MPYEHPNFNYNPLSREKWYDCRLCPKDETLLELKYDAGSSLPVVGETLTGGTSGDTGVVDEIETILSGSWAGGDAAGYIWLSAVTGKDESDRAFDDNEAITGSAGAALVADGTGTTKRSGGIKHPRHAIVEKDGQYYCAYHYRQKFGDEGTDEPLDLSEDGRGEP
jgi:hypothetical protein